MINYFHNETLWSKLPLGARQQQKRAAAAWRGLLCDFNIVALGLRSKACVQRQTKGSVEAFDVRFFCVQASWLLMRQPAGLCEALTLPHDGTASSHWSEATNYGSLAPHCDWRPTSSPFLMAPEGHRIVCTHKLGLNQLHRQFLCRSH